MGAVLDFLRGIGESVGAWLYVIAGGLAFAEAAIMVGVVLPGETALLVAGFAAHEGVISLVPMIIIAIVCAIAGDSVGYEVGRAIGPRLQQSRLGRFVGERTGGGRARSSSTATAGRPCCWAGAPRCSRALVPGLAGMARMPYLRTFLPWNAVGGDPLGRCLRAAGLRLRGELAPGGEPPRAGPDPGRRPGRGRHRRPRDSQRRRESAPATAAPEPTEDATGR